MRPQQTMTPMQLEILLHYSYSSVPYKHRVTMSDPAGKVLLQEQVLEANKLLEVDINNPDSFKLSGAGKVLIDHILSTPLPVQKWAIPERTA